MLTVQKLQLLLAEALAFVTERDELLIVAASTLLCSFSHSALRPVLPVFAKVTFSKHVVQPHQWACKAVHCPSVHDASGLLCATSAGIGSPPVLELRITCLTHGASMYIFCL